MVKVIVFEDGKEIFRKDAECALVVVKGEKEGKAMLTGSMVREEMIKTIGEGIARLLVRSCPGNEYDASREIGQLIKEIRVEGAIEEYKKYVGW